MRCVYHASPVLETLAPRGRHGTLILALLWLAAVLAIGITIERGLVGENRHLDAKPLALAGHAWTRGLSPYVPEVFSSLWQEAFGAPRPEAFVFAYPPIAAAILAPLGVAGVDRGVALLDWLNLLSLGVALFLCARLGAPGKSWRDPVFPLALCLACSVGALSATLLLGQSSLWILCAIVWLWIADENPRPRASTVLAVAVAAMKPSLSLPVLCFLAVRRPLTVAWAFAVSLVVCVAVAAWTDGIAVLAEWLRSLSSYSAIPANAPIELASAQQLVARGLPQLSLWWLTAAGALAGAWLGWSSRRAGAFVEDHWLAVIALALAVAAAHPYDMVLAAPLAALVFRVVARDRLLYAIAVLAIARPAIYAKLGSTIAQVDPTPAVLLVSGIAVALLAAGILFRIARDRQLLAQRTETAES
jgi:glycosyl transferase family 87